MCQSGEKDILKNKFVQYIPMFCDERGRNIDSFKFDTYQEFLDNEVIKSWKSNDKNKKAN